MSDPSTPSPGDRRSACASSSCGGNQHVQLLLEPVFLRNPKYECEIISSAPAGSSVSHRASPLRLWRLRQRLKRGEFDLVISSVICDVPWAAVQAPNRPVDQGDPGFFSATGSGSWTRFGRPCFCREKCGNKLPSPWSIRWTPPLSCRTIYDFFRFARFTLSPTSIICRSIRCCRYAPCSDTGPCCLT